MLTVALSVINLIFLVGAGLFTYESLREKEPRPLIRDRRNPFHLMLAESSWPSLKAVCPGRVFRACCSFLSFCSYRENPIPGP